LAGFNLRLNGQHKHQGRGKDRQETIYGFNSHSNFLLETRNRLRDGTPPSRRRNHPQPRKAKHALLKDQGPFTRNTGILLIAGVAGLLRPLKQQYFRQYRTLCDPTQW
jgi:hypothetical protein